MVAAASTRRCPAGDGSVGRVGRHHCLIERRLDDDIAGRAWTSLGLLREAAAPSALSNLRKPPGTASTWRAFYGQHADPGRYGRQRGGAAVRDAARDRQDGDE